MTKLKDGHYISPNANGSIGQITYSIPLDLLLSDTLVTMAEPMPGYNHGSMGDGAWALALTSERLGPFQLSVILQGNVKLIMQ